MIGTGSANKTVNGVSPTHETGFSDTTKIVGALK